MRRKNKNKCVVGDVEDLKNVSVLATIIFLFPCQLWQLFQAATQQTFTKDLNCKAIGQNMALGDSATVRESCLREH